MRPLLSLTAALLAVGCASGPRPSEDARATAKEASQALPFIENDLPLALSQAQREGKPLFVDAWAPW
ncbi:MAG TPA: hypothetical protein VE549_05680 [Myxococcaceae bacterium]|nr:hypothetical protein [Myxococcaceae bacterium]